jgi:Asp-tRNA(Asn)/Glu-tRNA(Gln) amidotransferase A subunit family amidase
MDDTITTWSATRQAAAIRAGEVSSRELLEQQLARIELFNPMINAVVTLDAARSRAAADAADADASRGAWHGPLPGLPITIKDAIEVAGMRSTGGAVELPDHLPEDCHRRVTSAYRAIASTRWLMPARRSPRPTRRCCSASNAICSIG